MDADLQDPPEVIPSSSRVGSEGFDVVYAMRGDREGESRVRLLAIARLLSPVPAHLAARTSRPNTGDFRLLSRRAVDCDLRAMPERARFLRGMTSWIGFRQIGVTYRRDARFAGASKYPLAKLVRLASDGITSFSTAPIELVTRDRLRDDRLLRGVLGWTLYTRFFTHSAPQGWTSVLAVVLLLGGIQLLGMGIVGQYIARIFEETKQRPLYLVDEWSSVARRC